MKVEATRVTLGVWYLWQWRSAASSEGGAIEVRCIRVPEGATFGGEWEAVYERPDGERVRLLSSGRKPAVRTFRGANQFLGFLRQLGLEWIELPLREGDVRRTEFEPTGVAISAGDEDAD